MGKKKKEKMKFAQANLKMLETGKIKISKKQKFNILPFVSESIDKSIVAKLGGFISKEEVVVENKDTLPTTTFFMTDILKGIQIYSKAYEMLPIKKLTAVIVISKKKALEEFNIMNHTDLGLLLRTTTLAPIYKGIKSDWEALNKDTHECTPNIMYVPDVKVIVDANTGKYLVRPYSINVLVIAVPKLREVTNEGLVDMDEAIKVTNTLNYVFDAIIQTNSKNIVLNPYGYKLFAKNKTLVNSIWKAEYTSQDFMNHVNEFVTCIEDENDFISFTSALKTE